MKVIVLLSFLLFSLASQSQAPDWSWARTAGSSNTDMAVGMVTDHQGNSYVTGQFSTTATFGNIILDDSAGNNFIAKYDSAGNAIWAIADGGHYGNWTHDICVDAAGNCYVIGYFTYSAIYGGDTISVFGLPATGASDIFIVKYDSSGNFLWVKSAGGTNAETGWSISCMSNGVFFITGYFLGTAYFGNDTIISNGGIDIFVAKYDASGNVIWAKNAGGAEYDLAQDIACDKNGGCVVTGRFEGSCYFGNLAVSSNGDYDVFTVRYDMNGNEIWVQQGGGSNTDLGEGIAVDPAGNCYVTGYYAGGATFGNTILFGFGGYDVFTAKYDLNGNLKWVRRAGGAGSDFSSEIFADDSGRCTITGSFYAPGANFSTINIVSTGSSDVFVAEYDSSGNILWVQTAGGLSYDYSMCMSYDGNYDPYVAGRYFMGPSYFGSETLTSIGGEDIFLAKLSGIFSFLPHVHESENYCAVFPNPFTTTATITINQPGKFDFMLYNAYGKEVEILKSEISKFEIKREDLPTGIYFYRIEQKSKLIGSGKVVIE